MPSDPEKLRKLAAWMLAWRTAWEAYVSWIQEEYAGRLAGFEGDRAKARVLLDRAAREILPFDADGRLDPSFRTHAAAKRLFRKRTDQILQALVERGLDRFGARGRYDRMGVFQGKPDPALRRLALNRIRDAFRQAANAADELL